MRNMAFMLALVMFSACSDGPPEAFRLGSQIPMGAHTLTVSGTESNLDGHEQELVVFFQWNGPVQDLVAWFPRLKMTAVDEEGNKYTAKLAVPEEAYSLKRSLKWAMETAGSNPQPSASDMQNLTYLSERLVEIEKDLNAGRNPGRWVYSYDVPSNVRGLTLHVKNPDPRQGQARLAAIPLGR